MKTMLFYCTHIFIVPAHIMLWHICVSSTQSTPLSPRHDPVQFQSVMYTSSSREIPLSGNVSKCECNAEDIVRESQISSRAGWSKEYEDFTELERKNRMILQQRKRVRVTKLNSLLKPKLLFLSFCFCYIFIPRTFSSAK